MTSRKVDDGLETRLLCSLLRHRYFDRAWHHLLEQNSADRAVCLYLQRSAHYMVHGVPLDWTGVETLDEK